MDVDLVERSLQQMREAKVTFEGFRPSIPPYIDESDVRKIWNASRTEAFKEAAGIAKRYGHKLWPLEGSSHDDLERRVSATIIRACEAIVQGIEARMK